MIIWASEDGIIGRKERIGPTLPFFLLLTVRAPRWMVVCITTHSEQSAHFYLLIHCFNLIPGGDGGNQREEEGRMGGNLHFPAQRWKLKVLISVLKHVCTCLCWCRHVKVCICLETQENNMMFLFNKCSLHPGVARGEMSNIRSNQPCHDNSWRREQYQREQERRKGW